MKIAGYSGEQFDGAVWGIYGHGFIPFTPKTRGGSPPDTRHLQQGEAFRIAALAVKGKTVVVLKESAELPAAQFPAFLASATGLLSTLRFPTS